MNGNVLRNPQIIRGNLCWDTLFDSEAIVHPATCMLLTDVDDSGGVQFHHGIVSQLPNDDEKCHFPKSFNHTYMVSLTNYILNAMFFF